MSPLRPPTPRYDYVRDGQEIYRRSFATIRAELDLSGVPTDAEAAMTAESHTLALRGDHVTLAQAVKAVGLADTGGQAKVLVREGTFEVNGAVEKRPGRKLVAGDRFGPAGARQWTVTA